MVGHDESESSVTIHQNHRSRCPRIPNQALTGDLGKAVVGLAPKAVSNLAKGVDMMSTGMYRDDKGYKVIETTPTEAAMKTLGFQSATVAEVQQANHLHQRSKDFYNQPAQDIG